MRELLSAEPSRVDGNRHEAGHVLSDHTLYAKISGVVEFDDKGGHGRWVSITPAE